MNTPFEIQKHTTESKRFSTANARHTIIARLVERVEISHDYEVGIKFRISVEQYMRMRHKGRGSMSSHMAMSLVGAFKGIIRKYIE